MAKLYGLGIGPGDPELITLKAKKILEQVDYIFCPEKEKGSGSVALEIINQVIEHPRGKVIYLTYPMHNRENELEQNWKENAELMWECLKENRTGAFITLGDTAVYSTLMYTIPYIKQYGIKVELIPGIPSFCAAANIIQKPLMVWNEDLIICTVSKNQGKQNLNQTMRNHDNIVLMKPSADKEALVTALRKNHLENHFTLISKAGTMEERIITDFEELLEYKIPYLSIVIIKKEK